MGPRNEYTKSSTTSQQEKQPLTFIDGKLTCTHRLHHILEIVDYYITYWKWWTTTSHTGNGGLVQYVLWTWFRDDGNVSMQFAASTASD